MWRSTWYFHDITDDVKLDHLVKVVFAGFLQCDVTIFPFLYFFFLSEALNSVYFQSRRGNCWTIFLFDLYLDGLIYQLRQQGLELIVLGLNLCSTLAVSSWATFIWLLSFVICKMGVHLCYKIFGGLNEKICKVLKTKADVLSARCLLWFTFFVLTIIVQWIILYMLFHTQWWGRWVYHKVNAYKWLLAFVIFFSFVILIDNCGFALH